MKTRYDLLEEYFKEMTNENGNKYRANSLKHQINRTEDSEKMQACIALAKEWEKSPSPFLGGTLRVMFSPTFSLHESYVTAGEILEATANINAPPKPTIEEAAKAYVDLITKAGMDGVSEARRNLISAVKENRTGR